MADGLMMDPKAEIARLEAQLAQLRGGQQGAFAGRQGGQDMRELYGLMAQYGDNPAQAGNQYANAVQQQQALDMRQQQMDRQEKQGGLLGTIPMSMYTPESVSNYWRTRESGGLMSDAISQLQFNDGITSTEEKNMFGVAKDADTAAMSARNMRRLAGQFANAAPMLEGFAGTVSEGFKRVFGMEDIDDVTALRTQYQQLRNSEIINNLPPGVASDRDMMVLERGWPDSVADADYMAQFLTTMGKMATIKAAQEDFKLRYMEYNNGSIAGYRDAWRQAEEAEITRALQMNGYPIDQESRAMGAGQEQSPPAAGGGTDYRTMSLDDMRRQLGQKP